MDSFIKIYSNSQKWSFTIVIESIYYFYRTSLIIIEVLCLHCISVARRATGLGNILRKLSLHSEVLVWHLMSAYCYSRQAGHRFGEHLEKMVPPIVKFCREEDDELREYCLQAFESFVRRCPKEISPFVSEVYCDYPPPNKQSFGGCIGITLSICLSVFLHRTSCPGHNFVPICPIWMIFHTIVVHNTRVCHDLDPRSYLQGKGHSAHIPKSVIWIVFHAIVVHAPMLCHDLDPRSYL